MTMVSKKLSETIEIYNERIKYQSSKTYDSISGPVYNDLKHYIKDLLIK